MWSYVIDNDDNVISIRRDSTVYLSVSFSSPSFEEKVTWLLEETKQAYKEFPEECVEILLSVTIPCLTELCNGH